jgi:hypothetical protein
VDVSKPMDDIETGVARRHRDESGGSPFAGQAVSGMKVARAWSAATARNMGRHGPKQLLRREPDGSREPTGRRKPEVLSTVAGRAGGPTRSSGEAPVMGVERRGRLIVICSRGQPGVTWEETR